MTKWKKRKLRKRWKRRREDDLAKESAMSMAGSPSWAKLVPSSFGCSLWLLCGAPLDMRDQSLGYSKDEDIL